MGLTMIMFLTALIYIVMAVKYDIIETICVRSDQTKPSKPGNLALKDLDDDSVVLSWSEPKTIGLKPIRFYVLAFRDTKTLTSGFLKNPRPRSTTPWTIAKRLSPYTLSVKWDNLTPGKVYEFKVFACSQSGIGAASNIFVPMPKHGEELTEEKKKSYTHYLMEVIDKGVEVLEDIFLFPINMWHELG